MNTECGATVREMPPVTEAAIIFVFIWNGIEVAA